MPTGAKIPCMSQVFLGDRFGRWLVADTSIMMVHYSPGPSRSKHRYVYFAFLTCDCGTEDWVNIESVKRGLTKSCGCLAAEIHHEKFTTHGRSKSPIYAIWNMMQQRIRVPTCKSYKDYGGRGLDMDPRWEKFENFYADMGDVPFKGASLERKDNNVGYWPSNVVWATHTEQARNKRNTVLYEYQDKSLTLSEWSEIVGIKRATLASRLYIYGWTVDKALSTPAEQRSRVHIEV